jgi:DNA replicative helicase MCM subunit Mcm2 (Cdc46/Mcm family)
VETKVNPFFKIAKSLMEKMKRGGKGDDKFGGNDFGSSERTNVNSDFQTTNCKSRSFNPIEDGNSEFSDYQEIKLQELFKTLKPGLIPRSMCVIL